MKTSNPLLQAALRYADLGYPVFPCVPGASNPLTEHGFLDATTTADRIERWWAEHPAANVAIAAAGLLVLDRDPLDDGAADPWLLQEPDKLLGLAAAPTALTPRDGRHHVFRKPPGKPWRCTTGRLAPCIDTRSDGGYFVVAPSVRPDGAYRWVAGCELDVPAERLAEPPAWLAVQLDSLAHETNSPANAPPPSGANVIPQGQRTATLARLAGSMRRHGMSCAEIAAALVQVNQDRCMPALPQREVERIAASIARYEPDQVAVALAENHWEQLYADRPTDEDLDGHDPGPIPQALLGVPGFVGEVMSHTLETAPSPDRALAFCGALALQAFLAGRKARDESGNRTNLYLLALANSGAGKDHPRKVNQRVLLEVGLADCLGDSFASGEGIEDRLFLQPAMLFQTDEIDGLMAKINLGKDARHEGIMGVLLKMFTSSDGVYPMRVKAGREPGLIHQPCLCLLGTAIPKHYYEALSLKMLTNGFFARMLVVETGRRDRGQKATVGPLPDPVVEAARWWAELRPGGQAGNLAALHPEPRVAETTAGAARVLQGFRDRADEHYLAADEGNDQAGMALWARAAEKAMRLALVYACSADRVHLRITEEAMRWACAFAEHQTRRMLFMAGAHVSENDFDARCKQVVATLRKWREKRGDAWMPFWQISRKHPWSERDHEEVRTALINQRMIDYQESVTGGRPARLYRLLSSL